MSPDYYRQTQEALQLNGLSAKTQAAYLRAVRMLCDFHQCPPEQLSEVQLRAYYLHRRNVDHWSPSTLRISFCAVRFFFTHVLHRAWPTLKLLDAKRVQHLPAVLSVIEVRALLAAVRMPHYRALLTMTYACGLRLQEVLHLEVSDIDAARGFIHVHRGKGAKDRMLPLPPTVLGVLRAHWLSHRHPRWLSPALGRGDRRQSSARAQVAQTPLSISGVQDAMRQARSAAGIVKKDVSVHTLRHSYATHLLEAGVNLPTIQRYLGHAQIQTTLIYVHLTQCGQEDARARINTLMGDLQ